MTEIEKLKEEIKTYNNLYKIAFESSHKLGKDYQKLRAENVELVKAIKRAIEVTSPQGYLSSMRIVLEAVTILRGALSSSPSAKWLEAVESLIFTAQGVFKMRSHPAARTMSDLKAELLALEKLEKK